MYKLTVQNELKRELMSTLSIAKMSTLGLYVGGAIALAPAAVTLLIASSRIILVNIIANIALRILTAGAFGIELYGFSLVKVPFLWQVSKLAAIAGGTIFTLALTIFLANELYLRLFAQKSEERQQARV